ncbi:hypothetical protein [Streptomyces boncukensis]|uniref:Uncharacterized protein n=1 Tax=Streptomyces boncukensis TaxID=2711219 RepID=A0A6G4WTT2_9ACTN|nr:hypothetical protein [Streptomyces boncukensis]NGO67881.1 hypothetical protein [Streptomyces boncukensis]
MEWLVGLAPVLAPFFGMTGALGGAWLVYRQNRRKAQADERAAQLHADTAETQTYVDAMRTVTSGFTDLLEQQRAVHAQTVERVTTLEARHVMLEQKVESLQEEQRKWRRWKAAAVAYIHDLRTLIRETLRRPAPAPPDEIAADVEPSDAA